MSSGFSTELEVVPDAYGTEDAIETGEPVSCPGYSTVGDNVISFEWNESFGGATTQYRVQYRTRVVDGDTQIVRVGCEGSSLRNADVRLVARELRATDPVTVDLNGAVATLILHEKSGRSLTITVTSQNPHAELEYSSDLD